jgi:plasmid stabilization system protein ParE
MLRLEWTQPAADALEAAQSYYHELNPNAAHALARRVLDAARRLQVVSRTPYLLVYRKTE